MRRRRRRRRIGLSTLLVFMTACFVLITQTLHRLMMGRGAGDIALPSTGYNAIPIPGGEDVDSSFHRSNRYGDVSALRDDDETIHRGGRKGRRRRRGGRGGGGSTKAIAAYEYRHSHPRIVDASHVKLGIEGGYESGLGSSGSMTVWGYAVRYFGRGRTAAMDDRIMSARQRDDGPSNASSSSDGPVYDSWDGGDVKIKGSVDENEDDDDDKEDDGSICVPMANWQTTSYPNCNTVHEIDMVRSSGMGSYAFPKSSSFATTATGMHRGGGDDEYDGDDDDDRRRLRLRRRFITSHPPMRRRNEHLERILRGRRGEPRMNDEGLLMEGDIHFLGQGWFRSGWETRAERIPEYDTENGRWGIDETVVFKTLRFVY